MKGLIVGARGFLGNAIASQLTKEGWSVVGVGRSNDRPDNVAAWTQLELPSVGFEDLLRREAPDLVVNAAGPAIVSRSMEDPYSDFMSSLPMHASLLEAVRRSGVGARVVLISSAAVYGNPVSLPIDETARVAPLSPYGHHKRVAETISGYYGELYGLRFCSLRVFSAYGRGLRRQVVWDLFQKILSGSPVELFGTGEESRDFIHVTDVARAVAAVSQQGDFDGGLYNVGSGVETTIRDLAAKIVGLTRTATNVRFSGHSRPGDPGRWRADTSRLRSIGFAPCVSLEAGLSDYWSWIREVRGLRTE